MMAAIEFLKKYGVNNKHLMLNLKEDGNIGEVKLSDVLNEFTLHIAEQAVESEIDEWEFPETRSDAEMMANRILSRIKKLTHE